MPTARRMVVETRRSGADAGVSLRKRRRWYADDPPAGEPPATPPPDKPAGASNTDKGDEQEKREPVPYDRFKSVNDAKNEAEKKLAEYEREKQKAKDAADKADKERLAKLGEWEELAKQREQEIEQLKGEAAKAKAYEAKLKATNEARIQRIPEAWRKAVPVGYGVEELSQWLDDNEALFTKQQAPDLNPGARGDKSKTPDPKTTLKKTNY